MSFITEAGQFSLTGNVGGAILPVLDNISILGSGTIVVTGDPVLGTLTISGGGVTGMTEHAMVVGNAAGGITSLAVATDGQIPIGSTGNDVVLSTLTAGNNIGITNAAGSITIKVNGTTDHALQIGNATGDLTSLAVGSTGVILQGVVGADPSWSTATYPSTVALGDVLVASAANVIGVVNDVTNAGYVLTANVGAAPSFQALPAVGITSVSGTANQVTASTVAGSVTLSTPATFIAPGTIASTTTNTAGTDFISTAGNLKLPTSTSTVGQIQINSVRYLHNYGGNLFVGSASGNFTATSSGSTCVGESSGALIKASTGVTALGYQSASAERDGKYSVYIGYQSGIGHIYNNSGTGYDCYNTFVGANSGSVTSDNSNSNKHTAIGGYALRKMGQNSEGGVFVGYQSGYNIIGNHNGNTFIGSYSGYGITGKGYPSACGVGGNTLIGHRAAYSATATSNSFQNNCLLGENVGDSITTASGVVQFNTFLGSEVATEMTSGAIQNNVMIGRSSGAVMTTGNIQNNTFIGYQSGYSYPAASVPTYCINIGSGVSGAGTESYVTRIGQATGANAQTKCYIGGIYGITPAGTINVALVDSNGQLGSVASLGVAQGGTGAATMANTNGVNYFNGTSIVTTTVGTAGHVLTSNGAGSAPTFQSIGAFIWSEITDSTVSLVANNGYIMNRGTAITATLPSTCVLGKVMRIVGKGDGLTIVAQNANQMIHFSGSTTTTGVGGSLTATNKRDCLELLCVVADLEFEVISSIGNWTLV